MLNITNKYMHKTNEEKIRKVIAVLSSIISHAFFFQLLILYFHCLLSESQEVSILYLVMCPEP